MNFKFRSFLLFFKLCIKLILNRPFGNIVFDVAAKYNDVTRLDLRRLEKNSLKESKAKLDVTFLLNCKTFGVIPKFLKFQCHIANHNDEQFINKRLLKSATYKREKEHRNFEYDLYKEKTRLKAILSTIDYYIVIKAINKNNIKLEQSVINSWLLNRHKLFRNPLIEGPGTIFGW